MFDKATKKLVQKTDGKGSLIAASSVNDSKNLQVLAVVQKMKGWFWQQTKYKPTVFKFNDLLEGDPVKAVCEEQEFVKFEAESKNVLGAELEVKGSTAVSVNAKGDHTSKLSLSFGELKKETVDIVSLIKLTKGRKLDLSFFKKTSSKRKTLTLVKERIVTTRHCTISLSELNEASCQAEAGYSEINAKTVAKYQQDGNTNFDIPPDTVLAYSVVDIKYEGDGYFEWNIGPTGIESDDFAEDFFASLSDDQGPLIQEGFPLTTLNKALADVQTKFGALAALPAESRSSFLLLLRKFLKDHCVLSALVDRLEVLSSGEASCFSNSELSEQQSQDISAFLDLLKCDQLDKTAEERHGAENECSTKASGQNTELMYAIQMLMTALQEMMDGGLNLLEPFCTSEGLQSLQDLVIRLTTNDKPHSKDTISVFLQSESDFHRVEELFQSCNVSLKKENGTLTSEMTCKEGFLPVVLCISIHGLASFVAA